MKLEDLGFRREWKADKSARYEKQVKFYGNVATIRVSLYYNNAENTIKIELFVNGEEVKAEVNRELVQAILEELEALGW